MSCSRGWWGKLFFLFNRFLFWCTTNVSSLDVSMCMKLTFFFKSSSVFFWVPFRKITSLGTVAPAKGIWTKMINVNCCIETHMNRHYIFVSSSYGTILITICATHPGKYLKKRSHRWYTRMTVENKSSDTKWMTSSVAICLLSNLPVAIPITNKKQSRTLMLIFFRTKKWLSIQLST